MKKELSLREIRNTLGLSRRVIQGYEEYGLVKPSSRNKYGHLLYDQETVNMMAYIRFLQDLGLELKEIAEVIDMPAEKMKKMLKERSLIIKDQIQNLVDEYDIIVSYLDDSDEEKFQKAILKRIREDSINEKDTWFNDRD